MEALLLNTVESGTFRRKNKNYIYCHVPESPDFANSSRNGADIVGHLSWRAISSGVVVRPSAATLTHEETTKDAPTVVEEPAPTPAAVSQNTLSSRVETPQLFKWTDGLRKPIRNAKPKVVEVENNTSGMTRNCETLFSQMMATYNPVKEESCVDPSFSVRKIVKGSGLLGAFGNGQLEEEFEDANVEFENSASSVCSDADINVSQLPTDFSSSQDYQKEPTESAFNLDAFMNGPLNPASAAPPMRDVHYSQSSLLSRSPSLLSSSSVESERSKAAKGIRSPYPQPSSSPTYHRYTPSPVLYDTVVLQKTVETEVVQYMPFPFTSPDGERYSSSNLNSDSGQSQSKSDRSSYAQPQKRPKPRRKKRKQVKRAKRSVSS